MLEFFKQAAACFFLYNTGPGRARSGRVMSWVNSDNTENCTRNLTQLCPTTLTGNVRKPHYCWAFFTPELGQGKVWGKVFLLYYSVFPFISNSTKNKICKFSMFLSEQPQYPPPGYFLL